MRIGSVDANRTRCWSWLEPWNWDFTKTWPFLTLSSQEIRIGETAIFHLIDKIEKRVCPFLVSNQTIRVSLASAPDLQNRHFTDLVIRESLVSFLELVCLTCLSFAGFCEYQTFHPPKNFATVSFWHWIEKAFCVLKLWVSLFLFSLSDYFSLIFSLFSFFIIFFWVSEGGTLQHPKMSSNFPVSNMFPITLLFVSFLMCYE